MQAFHRARSNEGPRVLRVAFVTETFPPEINGVALTTAQFVAGLRRRGHRVQVIRPRQTIETGVGSGVHLPADLLMRGWPIPCYSHLRMGFPCTGALVRAWEHERPHVVHVATEGPLGWSALCAAQVLGLPVTSDFRTNFHAYSAHYGIGWLRQPIMRYLRWFHNTAACTMVPTDALRRELAAEGFERLHVVPRGVDTQRFAPEHRSDALRAQWGATPDHLMVAYVGRLAPEKNLPLLIEAFRAIVAQRPDAKLVLVGDGPMRDALRQVCPHLVLTGPRSGADLAAHYASCDLFLFPSRTETFGNVVAEALASGLPLVAFDHAAAGELVQHGVQGMLAPLADDKAFIDGARLVAHDAVRRQAMAQAARTLALSLSWDGVVTCFEAQLTAACVSLQDAPDPTIGLEALQHLA